MLGVLTVRGAPGVLVLKVMAVLMVPVLKGLQVLKVPPAGRR